MEKLSPSWITDGLIDFEYKKYVLLAYLKHVRENFESNKLYPPLAELIMHHRNLVNLQNNRKEIASGFPRELSQVDLKKLRLSYQKIVADDEVMEEIASLVQYALPRIAGLLREGKDMYDFLEQHLEMDEVGVRPLYDQEGYLLLQNDQNKDLLVYQFQASVLADAHENLRIIKTNFVSKETKSLARTVEHIKLDLVRKFKELPNPATFLFTSRLYLPISESFLPIAKRMLMRDLIFKA